ncbi:sensor histidine kinase [Paenibacillus sedimenti]|uniref:Histidine kinase n=1 Tax=Paenibacillus sedimenti TaxID=2770274 RepID=A0A926KY71_9BACL|nr:histidine kinase [Paenibacillus sedimenti]MBD0384428.1 histidine kinase [Paenibacillus sedimenti]
MVKYKIFRNMLIMLIVLLIPATLLFSYSNKVGENVLRETLENSAAKQLEFTVLQLEQSLRQLETQTLLLVNDSNIKAYSSSWDFLEYVDHLLMRKNVEEKLILQSQANTLAHDVSVYWPQIKEALSTKGSLAYQDVELAAMPKNKWFIRKDDLDALSFHLLFTNPSIYKADLSNVTAIVETAIPGDYLKSVLKGLDASGNGTSFLYLSDSTTIANQTINKDFLTLLEHEGALQDNTAGGHPHLSVLKMDGTEFLVQTIRVPSLGGTLVSYIQLNEFLSPFKKVNRLVNTSLILLFVSGVGMSYLLYRHFRIPFGYMVRKIESLGSGDYNSRAVVRTNNEFDYLFAKFNEMASRIQSLIENVYEERVRTREAEYKHLQSQINPHFLYNCLFYIVSMAHKSPDAVTSMAKNLAQFYRYITRKAGTDSTLADEISLIESYLQVQSLRNKRLTYEIDILPSMLELSVPTLLLQPLVENAVVHGLERKRDSGIIRIQGSWSDDGYTITVEDDGAGMPEPNIRELTVQVYSQRNSDEIGCGLWNIHHRLINQFGPDSGLKFTNNVWGGFCVTVNIPSTRKEEFPYECIAGGR